MDIEIYMQQVEQLLAEARPVPLSSSVMVNRKEFDDLLAELREHLPEELREARWVIKERDDVIAGAQREAAQVRADAELEQQRLVSDTDVVRAAQREAEAIIAEAQQQSRTLRLQAEDYVDGKLANFEIVLAKLVREVENGRERLRGRLAADALHTETLDAAAEQEASQELPAQGLYDHETRRR